MSGPMITCGACRHRASYAAFDAGDWFRCPGCRLRFRPALVGGRVRIVVPGKVAA